jgi:hypothetical protein
MPGNYDEGSFTTCDSDLQDVVGVYDGPDGQRRCQPKFMACSLSHDLPYEQLLPGSSPTRFPTRPCHGLLPFRRRQTA